ncbi:MAG: pilus assembly protein TadG-related protein [Pseudomonadota bacterium]
MIALTRCKYDPVPVLAVHAATQPSCRIPPGEAVSGRMEAGGAEAGRTPASGAPSAFARSEAGSITIWNLCWSIVFMILAGLTVDVSNAYRMQTLLQSTADAAALAAIIDLPDMANAVASADTFAAHNLNPAVHGDVLATADVRFGRWDPHGAGLQTLGGNAPNAIKVTVRRSADNENTLPTTFLRLIGFDYWNIASSSVATNVERPCIQNGVISGTRVEVMAPTTFRDGLCVHGQEGLTIGDSAVFLSRAQPSMPDLDDLLWNGVPLDPTFEPREGWLEPKMAFETAEILGELSILNPDFMPDYIDIAQPVLTHMAGDDLSDLEERRVHVVDCGASPALDLPAAAAWSRAVVIFNCPVTAADILLSDVVIASSASIEFNGLARVGRNDNCAPRGGVQVISGDAVRFLDDARLYGVQVVANGSVTLQGLPGETEGIAIQAGSAIRFTEADLLGACQGGVDTLDTGKQYRLVD